MSSQHSYKLHNFSHLHALEIQQIDILLHFVQRQCNLYIRIGGMRRHEAPGLLRAASLAGPIAAAFVGVFFGVAVGLIA